MKLSLGGSARIIKNTYPSAGMTLIRNVPEWLANLVRADLTRPNPEFEMPRGLSPEERALLDDRIRLWKPHPEGTLVPRYYWRQELAAFGEVEVLRGDVGDFEHTLQFPPLPHQRSTTDELDRWSGDIGIKARPAFGKTYSFFYRMAQRRGRGIVLVPNNNKAVEWRKEACKFLGIGPEQVGTIQGSKRDWRDKPFTVAMAKTVAVQEFTLEEETAFATVGVDEAHLSQAVVISNCLGKFGGERMAMTATPGRGLRRQITEFHFGNRWLSPETEQMPVRVEFLPVPVWEKLLNADWQWLRTMVGKDWNYAKVATQICRQLMDQGRRVLVLGNQIEPLARIYKDLGETGGFVCGQESVKQLAVMYGSVRRALEARPESSMPKRCDGYMDAVKQTANPILGTGVTATQPAGCGMDVKDLDGGVIMLPIAKRDTVTQVIGRFERTHPTKQNPLIVVLVPMTPAGEDAAKAMAGHLSTAGNVEVVFHAPVGRIS